MLKLCAFEATKPLDAAWTTVMCFWCKYAIVALTMWVKRDYIITIIICIDMSTIMCVWYKRPYLSSSIKYLWKYHLDCFGVIFALVPLPPPTNKCVLYNKIIKKQELETNRQIVFETIQQSWGSNLELSSSPYNFLNYIFKWPELGIQVLLICDSSVCACARMHLMCIFVHVCNYSFCCSKKVNQTKDASWPENIDNVQIFSSAGFIWMFYWCKCKTSTFVVL